MHPLLEELLQAEVCSFATANLRNQVTNATINFVLEGFSGDGMPMLYFETKSTSRKYANLVRNSQAAIAIYHNKHGVQLEGRVRELRGPEKGIARELLEKKYGHREFYNYPEISFFKFIPHWGEIKPPGYDSEPITFGDRR